MLALWERYLRQAFASSVELPVLAMSYSDLLSEPLAWCERARAFLVDARVPAHPARNADVADFLDAGLRHSEFRHADVLDDRDVSDAQRALFLALAELEGPHERFVAPVLPPETPATEALLAERRRVLEIKRELDRLLDERRAPWWSRIVRSQYAAPARRVYANARRLRKDDA